ncbi:MAG TPA: xanthine dehydrogenase family protein molybdopterin-binding subunit [Candidatus Limnocylindrales bacterium]|nr:xanthine dehydrogenase family protein molybdopterin-binding subunit [Candidatus Limnocylindrales bacterium]
MSLIGSPVARPDARAKVTGAARYPADLVREDMLHCKAVFAHRPHARIERIETARALAVPGVVAVLTASDVPYNRYGLIDADQEVLCSERVRYVGDRVALVIADDPLTAARAAKLVAVEYTDLPVVGDALAALAPDAPLVHESHGTNVLLHQKIRKGDAERAFAEADLVLSGTFTTSWQEHAYLQPDAGIAYYEGETLVVETAGQWLHEDLRQIAAMLKLEESAVAIRYAKIGGAFGGREDLSVQALLALATWKTKRPTAIVWSREESIVGHHKRHPFRIETKWGAKRDGTVTAVETRTLADGGAYASTSVEVLKCATIFAQGPYRVPNVSTDGIVVYTNNVPSGAFRGFGSPQAHWAAESMITRIAHALEIDPADVRRKNLYRDGDTEATGNVLPAGVSAIPVLERCAEEARRRFTPRAERDAHATVRRGVGIASGIKNVGYSFGFPEQSTATVELIATAQIERAVVRIGAADVGQGVHLILRQIVAEALALPLEAVALVSDDSAHAPNTGSASASRLTFMAGRAVHDAALAARAAWERGETPEATVQYRPPATTPLDLETGAGTPNYCYGYAAQAVEVEVDVTTGVTRVLKIVSVHDVGRAINRQQVEGQIEGCLAQALGYALTENFIVEDGRIKTPHFSTYLLPTTLDMPTEIVPVIMELADPHGPYGARGMAEMPLVPFAPAVAAAIYDATGAWVNDLPMTPERILAAITATRERTTATAESLVGAQPVTP